MSAETLSDNSGTPSFALKGLREPTNGRKKKNDIFGFCSLLAIQR